MESNAIHKVKPRLAYIDVCTGLSAASVAWKPLRFKALAFAEIEKFPSAVLAHHHPDIPNAGDFTTIEGKEYGAADILAGGTPCQSFSISGLRGGLSDARGNLALEFIKLAYRSNPEFVLWENVPGVLSSSKGQDFRSFLHGLSGVDLPVPKEGWKTSGVIAGLEGHYSLSWRVLDSQYFGVAQRRRRLFLVGHVTDWRRAASVLLEPESLLGNPAPRRDQQEETAISLRPRLASAKPVISTLMSNAGTKLWLGNQEAFSGDYMILHPTTTGDKVRRITPLEEERLFGFPEGYTNIPNAKDGHRYKALGNSMAVPVMRWIGERMQRFSVKAA